MLLKKECIYIYIYIDCSTALLIGEKNWILWIKFFDFKLYIKLTCIFISCIYIACDFNMTMIYMIYVLIFHWHWVTVHKVGLIENITIYLIIN
jgi:hypothetical protein